MPETSCETLALRPLCATTGHHLYRLPEIILAVTSSIGRLGEQRSRVHGTGCWECLKSNGFCLPAVQLASGRHQPFGPLPERVRDGLQSASQSTGTVQQHLVSLALSVPAGRSGAAREDASAIGRRVEEGDALLDAGIHQRFGRSGPEGPQSRFRCFPQYPAP